MPDNDDLAPPLATHPRIRPASRAEQLEMGRAMRKVSPRSSLAARNPTTRDPITHFELDNADRLQDLVPLRYGRMLESPFAFYRGAAGLMALDLGEDPSSGIPVLACGDAHIANFGFYASPERRLVFDLNDFDEAAIAPWEWDVKRLITSVIIGGFDNGHDKDKIRASAHAVVAAYADSLGAMVQQSPIERYFVQPNIEEHSAQLSKNIRDVLKQSVKAANKRTSERAVKRTTERDAAGRLRFIEQSPRMTHLGSVDGADVERLFGEYRASVRFDIASVLAQYRPTDTVRRVVGVGSVGTRCALQLLEGADDDTLVLQVKQARKSVLSRYGGFVQPKRLVDEVSRIGQGARVVNGQRLLQAVSDPFLGHIRFEGDDFYLRQFHDLKGSVEINELDEDGLHDYAILCATLLARAHSQSPLSVEVVGYIGRSTTVAEAIVEWSFSYADQSLADYRALEAAAAAGRIEVQTGVL